MSVSPLKCGEPHTYSPSLVCTGPLSEALSVQYTMLQVDGSGPHPVGDAEFFCHALNTQLPGLPESAGSTISKSVRYRKSRKPWRRIPTFTVRMTLRDLPVEVR